MLLGTAWLAGCDESKPCFAVNQRCDQSAQFSEYFDGSIGCCQGTCRAATRPPNIPPGATYNACQIP